jgi:hypothetical protein
MIARLIAAAKPLFGLQRPGRNLDVFPDDVFIVSYPKSGNTWTRFLIANLAYPEQPANFSNINQLTPDPEALSKRQLRGMRRPRLLKSHQYFDPRYPKVIYIVRDPRDVVVSQYYFHRKRRTIEDTFPIDQFVPSFVAGSTSVYGSWGENVASWLATRFGQPGFLLLRYEDMIAHTARELTKVASLLGIDATAQGLQQAVERSSADQMRKLENEQAGLWSSTRNTRQDVPFVREAKAGGWRSSLSGTSVEKIEAAWGPLMRWLGYDMVFEEKQDGLHSKLLEAVLEKPAR